MVTQPSATRPDRLADAQTSSCAGRTRKQCFTTRREYHVSIVDAGPDTSLVPRPALSGGAFARLCTCSGRHVWLVYGARMTRLTPFNLATSIRADCIYGSKSDFFTAYIATTAISATHTPTGPCTAETKKMGRTILSYGPSD
ncbi:protein of unknown function [Pararobbsia alpina]